MDERLMPAPNDELLTEVANGVAVATLNSERSLNALTEGMILGLDACLTQWERDPAVKAVVLRGAGEKAFCAGGDIRKLYDAMIANDLAVCQRFFRLEYALDERIHRFPKPIVVWGHGIVMGGGLGLLAGASHRVLTETSKIAMPEITIGLYPDVGASFFLNKMPGRTGLYLGLTGTRLDAADALFVGLADHFVASVEWPKVLSSLRAVSWASETQAIHGQVSKVLRQIAVPHRAGLKASQLRAHWDFVQDITDHDSALEFAQAMETLQPQDEWIESGRKTFLKGSPTSAFVLWEQLERARHHSLSECFALEYRLSSQFAKHPDFREGIRALIVDKDNAPKWQPARFEDVSPEWVNGHFAAL
jgi:enoyl-CoA hydratase/carnithine racemase